MKVHHVVADYGGNAVGGPVAVWQPEETLGVLRVIFWRISETVSNLRVVEHVEVLLPPDVRRAAEGFARYDFVDGLCATHGSAHGADVALAVEVCDAPVVIEDRRANEFSQAGPLDCLLVCKSLPVIHRVPVDVRFRVDGLGYPACDELAIVGVDRAGQSIPGTVEFFRQR